MRSVTVYFQKYLPLGASEGRVPHTMFSSKNRQEGRKGFHLTHIIDLSNQSSYDDLIKISDIKKEPVCIAIHFGL